MYLPERLIDWLVAHITKLPTCWKILAGTLLAPALQWRWGRLGDYIVTHFEKLHPAHYRFITKHGQNVVYTPHHPTPQDAWVVDYKHHTYRYVRDIPPELQHVGCTF